MTDPDPMGPHKPDAPHGPQRCTGTSKRSGKRCARWATPGATVCYYHGGGSPKVKAAAARRVAQAEARRQLDIPNHIDPRDALAEELARTIAWVRWLSHKVDAVDDTALIWGITRTIQKLPAPETTEEAKNSMWWTMLIEQRRHLIEVARAAHACGVEDRRVQILSEQADQLLSAMFGLAEALGQTADDPHVRAAIATQMRRVAAIETTATNG